MRCKCQERIINKIKGMHKDKAELSIDYPIGGGIGNDSDIYYSLPIEFQYKRIRINGVPEKRLTKKQIGMQVNFCPLCGKSVKEVQGENN